MEKAHLLAEPFQLIARDERHVNCQAVETERKELADDGDAIPPVGIFPRVRTPCGHGAQVIIEGREIQSDGGEKDKDNPTNKNNSQPQPKGRVSTIL